MVTAKSLFIKLERWELTMRDFGSSEFCDFLWISDLLSLVDNRNREFRAVLRKCGREIVFSISQVMIFGTIVEIKEIGDKGILYFVDDGTGIITCKYNQMLYCPVFDAIQTEQGTILNETFSNQSINESQFDCSADGEDTIFNDLSMQEEEVAAIKRSRLKALHSIWTDIENSLSCMIGILNIGDTVSIQGKLYSYYNTNQIYVNTIRLIDIKEELMLTNLKLEDGFEPCMASQETEPTQKMQLIENGRKSGVMTFDHIHHLETKEMTNSKILVIATEPGQCENSKKRKSIVLPDIDNSNMTFDTLTNLNDSIPLIKVPKIEKE